MAQLSSRLIISLVDRVTRPARGVHSALNRLERASHRIGRATTRVGSVATGAALYGITAMADKAEEFNKNIFGVGVAALADHTTKVSGKVVTDLESVKKIMVDVSKASMDISKDLGLSPGRISGIAETLAKAGFEAEKLRDATRAIAMAALTDTETTPAKLGEFGSVLETIYKPKQGEAWADFFRRQMNIVMVAADETRLSLGSTMEGMRAFAATYALMGNSEATNALLLMAGVKKGGDATEVGQTLKSDLVRALVPTQEGLQVMNRLGLKRSDYTDAEIMDPMRVTGNLARTFPGANIGKNYRKQLNARLKRGQEEGNFEEVAEQIKWEVAKRSGVDVRNADSRARFEQQFENAVFAGGKKFDMLKFLQDLITKGASSADVATLFNGRRLTTNMQILEGLLEFAGEYKRKLENADGSGLDAVNSLHSDSDIGRLRRYHAMIERFQIRLANSAGFERFLDVVGSFFDKLGSLDQKWVDLATTAGFLAVALAPVGVALGSLMLGVVALGRAARWASSAFRFVAGLFGVGKATATGASAASPLFGLGAGVVGGKAASAAGRRIVAGMSGAKSGAEIAAGARLTAGMTAAGAAASGAKAGGKGLARFIPGLGWVLMGGGAAWSAYDSISRGDSWWDVAKHTALGAFGLDGFFGGEANAAEAPGEGAPGPAGDPNAGAAEVTNQVNSAVSQIQAILASVDLTAEGQRIMLTLANGMRAGVAAVHQAASEAAAAAAGSALRGAYSDGAR